MIDDPPLFQEAGNAWRTAWVFRPSGWKFLWISVASGRSVRGRSRIGRHLRRDHGVAIGCPSSPGGHWARAADLDAARADRGVASRLAMAWRAARRPRARGRGGPRGE